MFNSSMALNLLISIPGLLLCLSLHEAAHGFIAYKLGDPTAKNAGRLTIDPFRHLDRWYNLLAVIPCRLGKAGSD